MENEFDFPVLFSFRDCPSWTENGEFGYTLYILEDGSVFIEEEPVLGRRGEKPVDRFPRGKIPEIVPQIRSFLEDHAKELEQIPSLLRGCSMDDNYIDIALGNNEFHLWHGELLHAFRPVNERCNEEQIQLHESLKKLADILADFIEILDSYKLPLKLEVTLTEGINPKFTDCICRQFSNHSHSGF